MSLDGFTRRRTRRNRLALLTCCAIVAALPTSCDSATSGTPDPDSPKAQPATGAQVSLEAVSYIGGSGFDRAQGCTIDSEGFIWIGGNTQSPDLPTTEGVFDRSFNGGGTDGFVAKFSPDLKTLVAATYLGGSAEDRGYGIHVDAAGSPYLIGITQSSDFPTTEGAFQRQLRGDTDVFVAKFAPDLSRTEFVTLLGGSNVGTYDSDWTRGAFDLDSAGNVVVAGNTAGRDFPTTVGSHDREFNGGQQDGFVAKISRDGSRLIWSTYVGGDGNESFYGNLLVHSDDSVTVGGFSNSTNFPTTASAIQARYSGRPYPYYTGDGVVVHLAADGSSLISSSYLWGSVAANDGIALDAQGRVNMAVHTLADAASEASVSSDALQRNFAGGDSDGSVLRLAPDGNGIEVATFLGGSGFDGLSGIAVDAAGNILVSGNIGSPDFPITADAVQSRAGGREDAVLAVVGSDASLRYATYLGGPGVDRGRCVALGKQGAVVVSGDTDGGMPMTGSGYDLEYSGARDGFIALFRFDSGRQAEAD